MSEHRAKCDMCGNDFLMGETGIGEHETHFVIKGPPETAGRYIHLHVRTDWGDLCTDCLVQALPKVASRPAGSTL